MLTCQPCISVRIRFRLGEPVLTSASYLVLYSSVHCCTAAIATQLGPGWTVSHNGSLTIQFYVQLWKTLLQQQTKYYKVLYMTIQQL